MAPRRSRARAASIEALRQAAAAPRYTNDRLSRQVYDVGGFNPSARDLHDLVRRAFAMTQVSFLPDPKRQVIVDWLEDVEAASIGDGP